MKPSFINMRIIFCCGIVAVLYSTFIASQTTKKKLQIGIKKRIDNCTIKSKKGDTLYMNYVGTLEDGTEFDNSENYNESFLVTLGYGQVIKGWEQGLMGMCVGEKRKLVIPSDLAYGSVGAPPKIPPNATIIFTVELVKIIQKKEYQQSEDSTLREEL